MFNGAFAKILEAQKITIRLLANFANSFDALDTQGSIHPRCELQPQLAFRPAALVSEQSIERQPSRVPVA
jgi:hypothetical protein